MTQMHGAAGYLNVNIVIENIYIYIRVCTECAIFSCSLNKVNWLSCDASIQDDKP